MNGVIEPMVNVKPVQVGKNVRMSLPRIDEVLDMPNLIEVQKNSYKWFLDEGLKEVFKDVSGITDYTGNLVLDFVDYKLDVDKPNYSVEECKERDATYAAALRVTARLLNKESGEIKESEVFMGDFPLMTESGTFVINGAERVIVSQLVRSPGVYYKMEYDKTGKELFSSTVIPNRGAWLEYENDANDVFYVRIDKNRKIPVTVFIRALVWAVTRRSASTSATTTASTQPSKRTPARTWKRRSSKSIESCARASPPPLRAHSPTSTACSLTRAVTTSPAWAATSTTKN